MRYYDPIEGNINIDRVNVRDVNLGLYRERIGLVSGQEPILFNTTIKQNILMGKHDASADDIEAVLK